MTSFGESNSSSPPAPNALAAALSFSNLKYFLFSSSSSSSSSSRAPLEKPTITGAFLLALLRLFLDESGGFVADIRGGALDQERVVVVAKQLIPFFFVRRRRKMEKDARQK